MPLINKLAWFSTKWCPSLVHFIVAQEQNECNLNPLKCHMDSLKNLCARDVEILSTAPVLDLFVASMVEVYGRHQAQFVADEYCVWGRDWGFELDSIVIGERMCVWHGECDWGTTMAMGVYISEKCKCRIEKVESILMMI